MVGVTAGPLQPPKRPSPSCPRPGGQLAAHWLADLSICPPWYVPQGGKRTTPWETRPTTKWAVLGRANHRWPSCSTAVAAPLWAQPSKPPTSPPGLSGKPKPAVPPLGALLLPKASSPLTTCRGALLLQVKVTLLADNEAGARCPYLVQIFTGYRRGAGTSAKVGQSLPSPSLGGRQPPCPRDPS